MAKNNDELRELALEALDGCGPGVECAELFRSALSAIQGMTVKPGYHEEKRQRAIRELERLLTYKTWKSWEPLLSEARWKIEHIEKD